MIGITHQDEPFPLVLVLRIAGRIQARTGLDQLLLVLIEVRIQVIKDALRARLVWLSPSDGMFAVERRCPREPVSPTSPPTAAGH